MSRACSSRLPSTSSTSAACPTSFLTCRPPIDPAGDDFAALNALRTTEQLRNLPLPAAIHNSDETHLIPSPQHGLITEGQLKQLTYFLLCARHVDAA